MSELSNLLLCKVAGERGENEGVVESFLQGAGTANDVLLPLLLRSFPHLVDEQESFTVSDTTLRHGLRELSPLSFRSASAHILGEAFQALMGPRLRGDKGQFFTPKSLVRCMVAVLDPPPSAKIVDPACGTGGFLVEARAHQQERGGEAGSVGLLIGIDKDRDLSRLSEAVLQVAAPDRSIVHNLNSLDLNSLAKMPSACSPMGADYVLTNPPFGAKIKVDEPAILSQYSLGHRWVFCGERWKQEQEVREAQDPQVLFLELCVRLLRPGGEMGIVLPEGVFGNSGLGYVWDFIRASGRITGLLDCPRTTFQPSTDVKTNVLFFQKNDGDRTCQQPEQKIWAAVALSCGHDRRGKSVMTTGASFPDDFNEIGLRSAERETDTKFWQRVNITDPYYLVPRYYDTTPIKELAREAGRLGSELISIRQMVESGYIQIRKGHEVGAEAYGTGDIPFIRTSDVSNYEVSIDPNRAVSEEIYQQFAGQQRLAPGNILMVSDGRYRIGRTALLHEHNYRCVVQSHLKIISVMPASPITAVELLYLLSLPMVQHQIRNLIFIQSTLGALGRRLNEVCLPMPERTPEWKATVAEFGRLIEGRASLLQRLHDFEHPGYEL